MKASTKLFTSLAISLAVANVWAGPMADSFITITHVTEGPPIIETDGFAAEFGVLPESALGSLLMPVGSVPLGPDGSSFHVVLFTDPATLLPTALVTLQATRGATDEFMYISFAAEGATGFASELAAYTGQPFTSTVSADGSLHDISSLLDSSELKFGMRISRVPDSGATAALLAFSLVLTAGLWKQHGCKRKELR